MHGDDWSTHVQQFEMKNSVKTVFGYGDIDVLKSPFV